MIEQSIAIPAHPARRFYEPCPECGADDEDRWELRTFMNSGGHTTYPWCCRYCGHNTHIYEKKRAVITAGLCPDPLPNRRSRPICAVCGVEGAEAHHWAPKSVFGEIESDDWPISYLCQKHHAEWHQRMNRP